MGAIERELFEKINRLSTEQQREVLKFVERLETVKQYSAHELMKRPVEERERRMSAAFAFAADEDFELFEYSRSTG